MRWSFDAEADALYIALIDAPSARQKQEGRAILDFDDQGNLVGIEILGVTGSSTLPGGYLEHLRVDKVARQTLQSVLTRVSTLAFQHTGAPAALEWRSEGELQLTNSR